MRKFIFSTVLILLALTGWSQNQDSLASPVKKTEPKVKGENLKFRSINAGIDVLGLIRTSVRPYSLYEVKAEADLKKYIAVLEAGYYSNSLDSLPKFSYEVSGQFFRIGTDVNFIHKGPDESAFTVGLRYGRAWQREQMTYSINDPNWGYAEGLYAENPSLSAGWMEAVSGLQVPIAKHLRAGFTARYKFGLKYKHTGMHPFEVAGYGRAETPATKNSNWGFSYYLLYTLNPRP